MDLVNLFESFGLPIAFLIVMIWFYVRADKTHIQERKEWREDQNKLQENTNHVIEELTRAIRETKD